MLRLQAGIDDPPSWVDEKPAKSDSSWEIAGVVLAEYMAAAAGELALAEGGGEALAALRGILPKSRTPQRSCSGSIGGRSGKNPMARPRGRYTPPTFKELFEAIAEFPERYGLSETPTLEQIVLKMQKILQRPLSSKQIQKLDKEFFGPGGKYGANK